MQSKNKKNIEGAKRIILKIGSSLLINKDSGCINHVWLESLCEDIKSLKAKGKEIVIVSSGAIALGVKSMELSSTVRLEDSQAAAAIGQVQLAHTYQDKLASKGLVVAQVLLTIDDSNNRRRYLNATNTLNSLIKRGVIPVINENDTVATQEIRYGDNDRLAARVAQMISADCLILFSDIDGLYTSDPNKDVKAKFIDEVSELNKSYFDMAEGPGSRHGSGGMITKLDAAKMAMSAGCKMLITSGLLNNPLSSIIENDKGTWFLPKLGPKAARKQWISGSLEIQGSIVIDNGAKKALSKGGSLLPIGVIKVKGYFGKGDAIKINDHDGNYIGCGLVAYDSVETSKILGCHSDNIKDKLGYLGRNEIIHRDDLVIT
ncbi:MAG: glutamate 5-kinase [Gammaproteobacteria bacterium TMED78]|nr:MAG: glutamate 5-kinase [Gammaproteobacteria bacterium TMED78]|tara:strand:- start:61224 stop:62348 length:1125 start_codon:yes stop_codon:yes gene_type:complete